MIQTLNRLLVCLFLTGLGESSSQKIFLIAMGCLGYSRLSRLRLVEYWPLIVEAILGADLQNHSKRQLCRALSS